MSEIHVARYIDVFITSYISIAIVLAFLANHFQNSTSLNYFAYIRWDLAAVLGNFGHTVHKTWVTNLSKGKWLSIAEFDQKSIKKIVLLTSVLRVSIINLYQVVA